MSDETLFYIFGIGLAVSAVVLSFAGMRIKGFPRRAFPLVVAWFAIFAIGASTYAVLHSRHEHEARAAETEKAGEVNEAEGEDVEAGDAGNEAAAGGEAESPGQAGGEAAAGTTLELAADETALAYDTDNLSASAGKVTIDFSNPSALEHDVAIERDGQEIAATEVITEGEDSLTTELEPGTYTFLCTVPGHAEAGMEGTLTVE